MRIFNFKSIIDIKNSTQRVANQAGQAVTEYILLLIFLVTMLFAAKGIFGGMNKFINNYVGEYIACLMEYGELPTLGVKETELNKHKSAASGSSCNAKFEGFSFAEGRPPTSGAASKSSDGRRGADSSSNSSKNSGSNRNSSSSAAASQSSRSSSESSSGANRSGAGRGSSSTVVGSNLNNNYKTADSPTILNSSKTKILDIAEDENNRRGSSARNDATQTKFVYQNGKYRALTGQMAEEANKQNKVSAARVSSRLLANADEGFRPGPYRKVINLPKTEKAIVDDKPEEGGFGYLFRWLIIAGMIIAFFILFGGQILNYSNSQDN